MIYIHVLLFIIVQSEFTFCYINIFYIVSQPSKAYVVMKHFLLNFKLHTSIQSIHLQCTEKVQLECRVAGMETKQKSFLLDNGRLQYDTVKRAFDLDTLEIFIG